MNPAPGARTSVRPGHPFLPHPHPRVWFFITPLAASGYDSAALPGLSVCIRKALREGEQMPSPPGST